MKGYMRPKNTVKQIEKAKYEMFKKQTMKVTALCSLAILNDVFDFPDEDLQRFYDNFAGLMDSIYQKYDSLDAIEKALKEEFNVMFEEVSA